MTRRHRCEECRKPFSLSDGCVSFTQWEANPTASIGHGLCALPFAEQVALADLLVADDMAPGAWRARLSAEPWMNARTWAVVNLARQVALDLKRSEDAPAPLSLMRPVAQSIPRRVPRTPDNPRSISAGTRTRVLERDNFRCRRCGHGPDVAPLVIDHIVPVAKGGSAALDNLQTLCRPCNAGKSDREPTLHDLGIARPPRASGNTRSDLVGLDEETGDDDLQIATCDPDFWPEPVL